MKYTSSTVFVVVILAIVAFVAHGQMIHNNEAVHNTIADLDGTMNHFRRASSWNRRLEECTLDPLS
jgi:hypothetical protein